MGEIPSDIKAQARALLTSNWTIAQVMSRTRLTRQQTNGVWTGLKIMGWVPQDARPGKLTQTGGSGRQAGGQVGGQATASPQSVNLELHGWADYPGLPAVEPPQPVGQGPNSCQPLLPSQHARPVLPEEPSKPRASEEREWQMELVRDYVVEYQPTNELDKALQESYEEDIRGMVREIRRLRIDTIRAETRRIENLPAANRPVDRGSTPNTPASEGFMQFLEDIANFLWLQSGMDLQRFQQLAGELGWQRIVEMYLIKQYMND